MQPTTVFLAYYLMTGIIMGLVASTALHQNPEVADPEATSPDDVRWHVWVKIWLISEFMWPLIIVGLAITARMKKD